ncbi:sulfatase-like hydrolase/transferase [Sphingobacterium sp. UT-1RO-CII-1]|uniref:phosphoethanolamine transferase n=1 Tax=Sphingobacterium sp. UT-1RO-CII-1 TaxID=2995225 RepID=UPI00227D2D01|nr:phosphoethanolamine transferase [Sphingobacterium sp. UT-1RO-CII-1]MCY4780251.1 sulfatase-like hydrolase/transferase [Sphingobacterium sp. UT-1RO-CII-1]
MPKNIHITKKYTKVIDNPIALFWFYILVNMAPSLYFAITQPIDIIGKLVIILFPLGLYMTIFSLFKNSGAWLLLCFPLIFLHAFQIVLFYLYGEDVIAADMFLNVATTNTSEINELLGSLLPSIVLVCALYIPPLVLAILQWKKKNYLDRFFRRQTLRPALLLLMASLLLSFFSVNKNTGSFAFKHEVYPINTLYNLQFAVNKWNRIKQYPETSKDFYFQAHRKDTQHTERQIYVLVIGETSRADNWQLYGYNRKTTPNLRNQNNLYVFEDALTQSNTTHKSVSIILSDVEAKDYNNIYQKKGIIQAFKEAGFKTICLSNQAENASFIEFFTKDADIYKTIRTTDTKTGITVNHYDEELVALMEEEIEQNSGDLFILLHTYGSHFNYMERYPSEFKNFVPDQVNSVSRSYRKELVNAYDNTILYTDFFLSKTIKSLEQTQAKVALLYTSDHGEDLFDDNRNKFLHASPTPTYYQLRIPFIMWFSDGYINQNTSRMHAVGQNRKKPISTNTVFHTMLHAAHIQTDYLKQELSLVSETLVTEPRMYLNDHDIAVPYLKMNLKKEDFDMLEKNNIQE